MYGNTELNVKFTVACMHNSVLIISLIIQIYYREGVNQNKFFPCEIVYC